MRPITEEDIYRYYLGNVVVGDMYNSPIPGRRDSTPSFQLYEKDGKIRWVDYGLPDQFGNSPENLVQYIKGLPLTPKGYFDAQRLITKEVKFGMVGRPMTQLRRRSVSDRPPHVKTTLDPSWYEYWKRFDIGMDQLRHEEIEACVKFGNQTFTREDQAFIYWWSKNPASYKLYRPLLEKKDKFRQFNIAGVIEGYNSLLKEYKNRGTIFDIIFVLSSTKDRLVVKNTFGDSCSGINPRGEKDRQDIITRKDQLLSMAKRVVCLYDADDPGYVGSMTLAELTGFEAFDVRGKLGGWKDFADMKDSERGDMKYSEIKSIISSLIF